MTGLPQASDTEINFYQTSKLNLFSFSELTPLISKSRKKISPFGNMVPYKRITVKKTNREVQKPTAILALTKSPTIERFKMSMFEGQLLGSSEIFFRLEENDDGIIEDRYYVYYGKEPIFVWSPAYDCGFSNGIGRFVCHTVDGHFYVAEDEKGRIAILGTGNQVTDMYDHFGMFETIIDQIPEYSWMFLGNILTGGIIQ